jgi:hypothetical protein
MRTATRLLGGYLMRSKLNKKSRSSRERTLTYLLRAKNANKKRRQLTMPEGRSASASAR